MVNRSARLATAFVLAFAFSSAPLVADWCAAMCEAAHAVAAPSCHHATPATSHLGKVPAPCGQDHRPVRLDAATMTKRAADRVVMAIVPVMADSKNVAQVVRTAARHSAIPIDTSPLGLALASTLRI